MICFKVCLALISSAVVNGHVKRGLGFAGQGTYHGDSDGHTLNLNDSGEKQINTRQGVAAEYNSRLSNFPSVGHSENLANPSLYFHSNHINAHVQNNANMAPNLGVQSVKSLGIPINIGYGPITSSAIGSRVNQNVVIPFHQSKQPQHFAPFRQIVFTGPSNSVQDYRTSPMVPATSPVMSISPQTSFGIRIFPVNQDQTLYGRDAGSLVQGNGYMGQVLGSYSGNQFGLNISPQVPTLENHAFTQNTVGYQAGHQQVVGNPHFESGPSTQYNGPETTFPSGHVDTGNTHNYENPMNPTVSTPETQHTVHSTESLSNGQQDDYSNTETQGHGNEGTIDSVNDFNNNKQSEEINTDYQDFNNNNPVSNYYNQGNSAETYQNQQTSQEIHGDSVGSYVNGGDSSQNHQANSGEQNYGSEQGNANTYDHQKNSHNPGQYSAITSSSLVTNGHAVGHRDSGEKATSFQSFVIHSYKPKRVVASKITYKPFLGGSAEIKSQKNHYKNDNDRH